MLQVKEELAQLREKVSKAGDGKVDANTVLEALNKAEETLIVFNLRIYFLCIQ